MVGCGTPQLGTIGADLVEGRRIPTVRLWYAELGTIVCVWGGGGGAVPATRWVGFTIRLFTFPVFVDILCRLRVASGEMSMDENVEKKSDEVR